MEHDGHAHPLEQLFLLTATDLEAADVLATPVEKAVEKAVFFHAQEGRVIRQNADLNNEKLKWSPKLSVVINSVAAGMSVLCIVTSDVIVQRPCVGMVDFRDSFEPIMLRLA